MNLALFLELISCDSVMHIDGYSYVNLLSELTVGLTVF